MLISSLADGSLGPSPLFCFCAETEKTSNREKKTRSVLLNMIYCAFVVLYHFNAKTAQEIHSLIIGQAFEGSIAVHKKNTADASSEDHPGSGDAGRKCDIECCTLHAH